MLKHVLLAVLCTTAAQVAFAQTSATTATTTTTTEEVVETASNKFRVETNKFWSNWFVGVTGGAQIYFGDHDKQIGIGKRLSPSLNVYVGKWLTPAFGLRLEYSGLSAKGCTRWGEAHSTGEEVPGWGSGMYYSKFKYGDIHADALVNVSNLFSGYREDRFWDIIPYAGLGFARTYEGHPRQNEVSAGIGLLNEFRLCEALDLILDIRGMYVNDRFDGETGHRFGDGSLSANLGLAYNFKPRGFDRSKTIVRTNTVVVGDNSEKDRLKAERDQLQAQLDSVKAVKAKGDTVRFHDVALPPYYVVFVINKSDLSKASRINLGILASLIKEYQEPFVITGYADSYTGNDKINTRLSRARAQAVYDCLVKEYNVPENLLEMEFKGGVGNMYYDDPALSRAAIARKKN